MNGMGPILGPLGALPFVAKDTVDRDLVAVPVGVLGDGGI